MKPVRADQVLLIREAEGGEDEPERGVGGEESTGPSGTRGRGNDDNSIWASVTVQCIE